MKQNYILLAAFLLLLFILASTAQIKLWAQDEKITNNTPPDDIIMSARVNNWVYFEKVTDGFQIGYEQFSEELLGVLKDPKTSKLNQCAAAHYLGKMRVSDAVSALADDIKLRLDKSQLPLMKHSVVTDITEHPAMDALINIGNPSIPAVIRNLAENDDAKVRELSLQVLYRIDGDKDISQLRLQRALKAEKDLQKQARLQAALKSLAEQH